ncbi:hypothetical protein [Streptomyces sp. NPDC002788]
MDAEDVFAHPLLHGGELVPAEPLRPHPPSKVLALVDDVAWFGGQFAALLQVLPGEVEGALRGVDLLELFAPFLRQGAGS